MGAVVRLLRVWGGGARRGGRGRGRGGGIGRNETGGNVEAEDGAVKDAEGGFGLVGGDLVAGLEDAGEGEVGVLADLAADVGGVGLDVLVAGGVEGGRVAVVDGEGVGFAADP